MASTNPLPHAEDASLADLDNLQSPAAGGARKRGAGARPQASRRKSRSALRRMRSVLSDSTLHSGWPEFDSLKPILMFLGIPALLVLAITVTGGSWSSAILYPIAIGLGAFVAASTFRGVELVMAVLLIYLPFSKVFVVPIAPGVNGTNMLMILGLFAAVLRLMSTRQRILDWPAGTWIVLIFGLLSSLSAFTVTLIPGGRVNLLYSEFLSYKAWVDQFIFYFIAVMCIRDTETAKRAVIYVMIGSVLVVLYSVPEMLEKAGRSTIEKSRIGGPHLQSNNFGGFVAYTILPIIAFFVIYIRDIRAWLLTPYFLMTAKVLITTFSRGAYVAMVVGALLAGWFKGKGFLGLWLAIALSFVLVFPSVIPESILARMDSLHDDTNSAAPTEEQLDQSSVTRLIMWRAAATMIAEDPIWGKGFKAFPMLKEDYTEVPVKESDPHSMYLYLGSQMGLPTLSLFLFILGYSFWLGRSLSKNKTDRFIKAIGIGGASATACFAVVNIFGSRAVSLNFSVYFWTFLVVMQVLRQAQLDAEAATNPKRTRTNAFKIARSQSGEMPQMSRRSMRNDSSSSATQARSDDAKEHSKGWQRHRSGKKARGPSRGAAFHQALSENEAREAAAQHELQQHQPESHSLVNEESLDAPFVQRKSRRIKKRFPPQ